MEVAGRLCLATADFFGRLPNRVEAVQDSVPTPETRNKNSTPQVPVPALIGDVIETADLANARGRHASPPQE